MAPALTVLGAGIAGLAASHAAAALGRDCVLYEAAPRAGGLLDSITVHGYRFDRAVHLSFADQPEVRAFFDQTEHATFAPSPRCVEHPYWLKHPVQNNLYPLPVDQRIELIQGFVERPDTPAGNYKEWLIGQYGRPISARYAERYTEKYWTVPAEKLGIDWVGPRIHRPALPEVLLGAMTEDTPSVYYAPQMRYPARGGYRAFIEPLIAQADIRLDHRLCRIDVQSRHLHFTNGEWAGYERLISTLPLPVLAGMVDGMPESIRQDADSLVATTVDLVCIGIARRDVFKDLWFYIYDDDIAAARASCPGVQAADNCPPGCSSIQFEIYGSSRRPVAQSVQALQRNCVQALQKWGFATESDIAVIHHQHVPYANVVFEQGMEQRRNRVLDWLASLGIASAGRFGEWDYLWSHQAFQSGAYAARRVLAV